MDENNEYALKALDFAKEEYNKGNNDGYITEISRIFRLKKQVVSGMLYSMDVEAVVSPCSYNELSTEDCQNQGTTKQRCTFSVLDVPWRKFKELRSSYCRL